MARYRVDSQESGGSGGLYEIESTQRFQVVEIESGKILLSFEGAYSGSYDGVGWDGTTTGVYKVVLNPDETSVLVYTAGKPEPEIIPIPQ